MPVDSRIDSMKPRDAKDDMVVRGVDGVSFPRIRGGSFTSPDRERTGACGNIRD